MRANSGQEALEILTEVVKRGDQVALLIADQRMPGMSGTEYLAQGARDRTRRQAGRCSPRTPTPSAAIEAINEVALDYYLLKPWNPPEEKLFPQVEDQLEAWEAGAALEAGGVRLIGHRFSRDSHVLARLPRPQPDPGPLARHRTRFRGARPAASSPA